MNAVRKLCRHMPADSARDRGFTKIKDGIRITAYTTASLLVAVSGMMRSLAFVPDLVSRNDYNPNPKIIQVLSSETVESHNARRLQKEPMATNRLVGKNIIITGATSGLGVDLAAALSAEGANVFIGGRRTDLGAKVAEATQSTFYAVDVADETSSQAFFLAAERHFAGAVASVG
jgi:hypothetical protein